MSVINILSPHVADLIAAGEVVERPASVVKELVENSIDAGAKNITVELRGGGMRLIRVSDDGCGMAPEDAGIAFLRHATSKLRDEHGLESIATLGFRGEALAAISSVSHIELLTRRRGDSEGTRVLLTAGDIDEMGPAGCREGTVMAVRDLFFNTPARLKFTKSDKAEGAACTAIALRCALGHPEVSVRLIRDGEEVFFSPGDGQAKSAVYSLLGRDNAAGLIECSGENDAVSVSGFVSAPHAGRGSRGMQYFFINGRAFKSASIQAALEQAYKNTLLTGRFPGCVLYLTLSPGRVDVNVHPAKTEVKFTDEKRVFDCVYSAVRSALASSTSTAELTFSKTTRGAVSGAAQTGPAASGVQGFDPYGGAFKVRSAAKALLENIPPASKNAAANRAAMAAQGRDVTVFDPEPRLPEQLTLRSPGVRYAPSPLVPRPDIPVIHRDGSVTGSWPEPVARAGTGGAEAEYPQGGTAGDNVQTGRSGSAGRGFRVSSGVWPDPVRAAGKQGGVGVADGQADGCGADGAWRSFRVSDGVRPDAARVDGTPGGVGGAGGQADGSGAGSAGRGFRVSDGVWPDAARVDGTPGGVGGADVQADGYDADGVGRGFRVSDGVWPGAARADGTPGGVGGAGGQADGSGAIGAGRGFRVSDGVWPGSVRADGTPGGVGGAGGQVDGYDADGAGRGFRVSDGVWPGSVRVDGTPGGVGGANEQADSSVAGGVGRGFRVSDGAWPNAARTGGAPGGSGIADEQADGCDADGAGRGFRVSDGAWPDAARVGGAPGGSDGANGQAGGSGDAAGGTVQSAPDADAPEAAPLTGPAPAFRYIGETMNTYILVETAEGLLLIDKHAAHERMNFDRLMQGKGEIMSQSLLTPVTYDPGEDTAELIDDNLPLLEQAGFEVDRFGAGSVIIRAVPQGTPLGGETAMLEEICQKLRDGLTDDKRDEILHTVACKAAIKAGMTSDERELRLIAEKVVSGEVKYCPHGRPVAVLLTRKELDKQFKRIV